jgi:UDPglucose 6-dehydrogenase
VLFGKIRKHFDNNIRNRKFCIWGLSYKQQTDDIREASSLILIDMLLKAGAVVTAYDPAAMNEARKVLGDKIKYASDPYEAVKDTDALALMTEWPEFRIPDLPKMAEVMKQKVIFDGRNIYDPAEVRNAGFVYYGIGRR